MSEHKQVQILHFTDINRQEAFERTDSFYSQPYCPLLSSNHVLRLGFKTEFSSISLLNSSLNTRIANGSHAFLFYVCWV